MPDITSILKEDRVFRPPSAFSQNALINHTNYENIKNTIQKNPDKFWADIANELYWFKKWDKVLEWEPPFSKWFLGGLTNVSYNCIDRHLTTWRKNKAAIIWEGEPGEERVLTYQDLHREVCRLAATLKNRFNIKKGDRVALYMPMIPELPIAMLACARIGAIHSVIFGGFSSEALKDRLNDAQARLVITADGSYRRGSVVRLKENVDEALQNAPSVESVLVFQRIGSNVNIKTGRDYWWHETIHDGPGDCPAEPLDSEHPLYILYTSGTTGKPKGVVHTTGGYLVGTYITSKWIFDLKDEDTFWCTADIGWVTGHSYIVYGILANGATSVMYEGAANYPEPDRFWEIVDKYRVNILYTAPTAIRSFIKWGEEWPLKYDLSSLRLLGTVGEPINPEAWMWYHRVIGKERCPIVDTWWQTETGMILITPLPGITNTKPGSATHPFPGIDAEVVDENGNAVGPNRGGYLVLKRPWPAMLKTIYNDDERYRQQYWSKFPGKYFTGDGARVDEDGYFWIMGRVDDVINVSGHRLGTMEIESALVSHEAVAEAAVVGRPDEIKGQSIAAFVSLEAGYRPSEILKKELREHVTKVIGALARPDEIRFTDSLPKTRSGKIMRRLLKEIVSEGQIKGDTTTLEDISILAKLSQKDEE